MIIDSGGGLSPTITKTAWKILSRTERKKSIPRISRSRCPKNMSSSECCNQSISKRLLKTSDFVTQKCYIDR